MNAFKNFQKSFSLSNIIYFVLFIVLKGLSLFPLSFLYRISDVMCFVIRRIVKYRVSTVRENLSHSFPTKNSEELLRIEKVFYAFFCDVIVETIKLLNISDDELQQRVKVNGIDIIQNYCKNGHPVILLLGHYGNWEWVPAFTLSKGLDNIVMGTIYQPLHNKIMNRLILKIRSRFKILFIPSHKAYKSTLNLKRQENPFILGFISDQRPGLPFVNDRINFLNHKTAYIVGGEKIGDKIQAHFVFTYLERIKRGRYLLTFEEMNPTQFKGNEYPYMHLFYSKLETIIKKNPPFWLWTHKRWINQ